MVTKESTAGDNARPPKYDVVAMKDVMVPMRDRIRLAADIYLPAPMGDPFSVGTPIVRKFPALLERTPYDKSDPLWSSGKRVVAENTIFHDAAHPSHVVLPVIPKEPR